MDFKANNEPSKVCFEHNGKMYTVLVPSGEKGAVDALVAKLNGRLVGNGFEKVNDGQYYYITNNEFRYIAGREPECDTAHYERGDYFSDKRTAQDMSRAINLFMKMTRFAAEHGGIGDTKSKDCYEIDYDDLEDRTEGHLMVNSCWGTVAFTPIFKTEHGALMALEEFREDLNWYFTDFLPRKSGVTNV